jgi:hypothetical protein
MCWASESVCICILGRIYTCYLHLINPFYKDIEIKKKIHFKKWGIVNKQERDGRQKASETVKRNNGIGFGLLDSIRVAGIAVRIKSL